MITPKVKPSRDPGDTRHTASVAPSLLVRRSAFFWHIRQHLVCRAHNLRSLAATLCTEVVGHPHWRPTRAFANEPGRSCRSRPGVTTLRWKGTHGLLDFQFDLGLPNDVVGLFKRLGGTLEPGRHSGYSWIPVCTMTHNG